MLLLLTLAFLAGPTCRAQEIWGNKVGTYFIIRGEEQGEIRGIKIYFTILSHIKGIQLLFGKHWSILYGMATASHKEWLLEDGEHIIKVRGDACLCLNSLTFITNKGNHVLFGKSQGRSFEDSGGPDKHLVTVNGMLLSGCISGIGFDWRHVPENVVSTTPQREPITIPNTSKPKERSKDEDKDGGDGGNDKDDDENNVPKLIHLEGTVHQVTLDRRRQSPNGPVSLCPINFVHL
ncbi:prostatic spermine-binding protein isoform X2 [Cricetulus griseus]|uniref:Prostatic spermine-binding protein isoform X2 n=1 Tax=Cricetulus griseus TaxID=10029 RepID=A0A9J7KBR9_CRIGR|nr:prostatic spermine-binding protein isoform X2 [Cricetulus griseus]